jgi:hypothetical protein
MRDGAGGALYAMTKALVVVKWSDAHGNTLSAFSEHEIPHAAVEVQSVGWLLRDDEKGVSIAAEYCGDATWRGVSFVPRGMILDVKPVVRTRTRKPKAQEEHP